ncbi:enoyl-CoA hydratase/isomerase family protein [Pseudomonas nitroreducens]|uniref:Enoyl-CoA hydratase/isomerase family protein n=1 Tax=Pseudomonas nitroreducens TaxID=46680 RepID=A0ABS0KHW1_PSENT|nr:enoyl-CoA hydratase-related protein [Pseudomonas nitroreducens]MBG6287027.1 enoyl-CoA hydratase/isomerase family protein [Pseudomonas nitroreducens]
MSVLLSQREGKVEILTLNRPEQRNALNSELMEALSAALKSAELCAEVRVVVLTGAGDKAFCAGMDLKDFAAGPGDRVPRSTQYFEALIEGRFSKPVIAAAQGTAVAGGFELMLSCDLAVVSRTARFGIPEVRHGLFPGGGGVLLPARIPLAVALELGLTGETIDAQRIEQLGLANRVVAPEAVLATALELAHKVAANAPLGVAATKRLMWACVQDGVASTRPEVQKTISQVFNSTDAQEGARAFAEKRPPRWRGV